MARSICKTCYDTGWHDIDLIKITGTALGECRGSVGAFNLNAVPASAVLARDWQGPDWKVRLASDVDKDTGVLLADTVYAAKNVGPNVLVVPGKDCGLLQINIDVRKMGTEYEHRLLHEPDFNAHEGRLLFDEPGPNNGKRRFGPWVAYTSGWVMFPEWWTWHQKDDIPVGPWVPTGRFVHRAVRGWANFQVMNRGLLLPIALEAANRHATKFGIKGAVLVEGKFPELAAIDWTPVPYKPLLPPADGIGPRPKKNTGM